MNPFVLRAARATLAALAFVFVSTLFAAGFAARAHADDYAYPFAGSAGYTLMGIVRRVDTDNDHLTVVGDDDHVYIIDAYGADIIVHDFARSADVSDLQRGMRVRARGTLVGSRLVEARSVRVLADPAPIDEDAFKSPDDEPSAAGTTLSAVVRLVDPDRNRITVADEDGNRDVVDTEDATINLLDSERGATADLRRGMRVSVSGTRLPRGLFVADRVSVLGDAAPPPAAPVAPRPVESIVPDLPALSDSVIPPSPDPQYVLAHLDEYTGILIDARHLPDISRSPSPALYGPDPGQTLLYPDRSDVPTPDQVQDESIVRYYHTESDARAGICGANPLILPAQAVLTPAKDSLQLSANDMVLLNALEKKLHFNHTWKVGFLIPGDK